MNTPSPPRPNEIKMLPWHSFSVYLATQGWREREGEPAEGELSIAQRGRNTNCSCNINLKQRARKYALNYANFLLLWQTKTTWVRKINKKHEKKKRKRRKEEEKCKPKLALNFVNFCLLLILHTIIHFWSIFLSRVEKEKITIQIAERQKAENFLFALPKTIWIKLIKYYEYIYCICI